MHVLTRWRYALCVALLSTGCNEVDTGGRPDEDVQVDGTTTTSSGGEVAYPPGPYGVATGQVITDYRFEGFPSPASPRDLVPMSLGEFYNPTGDGVFLDGSALTVGAPKPRALGIVVGAVWCAPCQQEARSVLPEKNEILAPLGGQIFFVLADGTQPGVPATEQDLERWTQTFDTDFPAVLDTEYALGAVIKTDAYPANILIDTRTMAIVEVVSGVPPESYWTRFETLVRGE